MSFAEARDAARPLAEKGFALMQQHKYLEAIAAFEQAEAKFHAPPHLLYMARARVALGQLTQARALYDRIVSEQLASYAPDPFREAQVTAKAELAALLPKVPSIEVAAPEGWSITVDGQAVDAAALKRPLWLEAGDHVVRATAPAVAAITRSVHLEVGTHARIELVPTPEPTPPSAPPLAPPSVAPPHVAPAPAAVPAPTPQPSPAKGSLAPAVTAFAIGAVGVGVGSVTGAMSIAKVNQLASVCMNDHCDPSQASTADSAKTLGDVSTIAFAAGGAAVVVGVVLLAVRGASHDAAKTTPASAFGVRVEPAIGLGSIGLRGAF